MSGVEHDESVHFLSDRETATSFSVKTPKRPHHQLTPNSILVGRDNEDKWVIFHHTDDFSDAAIDASIEALKVYLSNNTEDAVLPDLPGLTG